MDGDFGTDKLRIQKLTGPNYRPWSVQVRRLLQGNGLWNTVVAGVEAPKSQATGATGSTISAEIQATTGPDLDAIGIKDAKASTIIMGLCAPGTLQHILLLG